ncbi:MAG TPA: hypothetical protein VGZ89_18475 [Xanthobacteraceae bacterium]|jgi:hypothetical protein|nr:hypothetical protein [Xanthobacteraceae bacterium]
MSDRLGYCRDIQIRDVADAGNLALPTHSENAYCFRGFAGHQKMPMWKLSATTKATPAILFATLVSLFANPPLSSMAEQPAGQQSTVAAPAGALIGGAAGATIAAEGELKATVRTYQSGNPSAVYRYYWWRDSCYVRYQSDELVSPEYCHQQP